MKGQTIIDGEKYDLEILEKIVVATKHEVPPELPNKPDRETFFDRYLYGYTENGIVYEAEEGMREIFLYPQGHRYARMLIITSGQYWGTRKFFIDEEEIDTQEEFERRLKLRSFE